MLLLLWLWLPFAAVRAFPLHIAASNQSHPSQAPALPAPPRQPVSRQQVPKETVALATIADEQPSVIKLRVNRYEATANSTEGDEVVITDAQTLYKVNMSVGTPPQTVGIVLDTGSSNLCIATAANQGGVALSTIYKPGDSTTAFPSGNPFEMSFGKGDIECSRIGDVVTFGTSTQGTLQVTFCGITSSEDAFQDPNAFSGLLGLGLPALAQPQGDIVQPFLPSFLQAAGMRNMFTLQLCDVTDNGTPRDGQLTLGGTDPNLHIGDFQYAEVYTQAGGGYDEYMVQVTAMMMGNLSLALCKTTFPVSAVIDSGTNALVVTPGVFEMIGIVLDPYLETICPDYQDPKVACTIALATLLEFPSITISLVSSLNSNSRIDLTVAPWQYFKKYGQTRYFAIANGTDAEIILGAPFLTGYDVVFDNSGGRIPSIGFATSTCATATLMPQSPLSPVDAPREIGPVGENFCPLPPQTSNSSALSTKMIIIIVVASVVAAFIAIWLCCRCCKKGSFSPF
eukprot:m.523442 g.523442  ORF g.523442 m.523442 type:complete len:511 (+) comp57523_c0_seq25:647-2179(+)